MSTGEQDLARACRRIGKKSHQCKRSRGLATARLAYQRDRLTLGNRKVKPANGLLATCGRSEAHAQTAYVEKGVR
jgi:hypothetical protein